MTDSTFGPKEAPYASNVKILTPNLKISETDGDNARLLEFDSGRNRILSYYGGFLDAIMLPIDLEMRGSDTNDNTMLFRSAESFAENCLEQARRLTRVDIRCNTASMYLACRSGRSNRAFDRNRRMP